MRTKTVRHFHSLMMVLEENQNCHTLSQPHDGSRGKPKLSHTFTVWCWLSRRTKTVTHFLSLMIVLEENQNCHTLSQFDDCSRGEPKLLHTFTVWWWFSRKPKLSHTFTVRWWFSRRTETISVSENFPKDISNKYLEWCNILSWWTYLVNYILKLTVELAMSTRLCLLGWLIWFLCFRFDALTELGAFMRTESLCVSVLRVASGPRVKLASCKNALNPGGLLYLPF